MHLSYLTFREGYAAIWRIPGNILNHLNYALPFPPKTAKTSRLTSEGAVAQKPKSKISET
jgi:hypothetical protein